MISPEPTDDEAIAIELARSVEWSCDICGERAIGFSYIGAHIIAEHQGGTATEVNKVC